VFQSQVFDDQADIARLFRVQETWLALADRTETAASRADVCGVVFPALGNIRAARLFTDRMEAMFSQDML
jgi:hypothetical protein